MTTPAKTPARRLLATYPTLVEAAAGATWWAGPPEKAKGVRVANAHCDGRQEITEGDPVPGVRKTQYYRPCGWEGVFESGQPAGVGVADFVCPDCGGRVELGAWGATPGRPFAVSAAKSGGAA